jgi:hypothetical protein
VASRTRICRIIDLGSTQPYLAEQALVDNVWQFVQSTPNSAVIRRHQTIKATAQRWAEVCSDGPKPIADGGVDEAFGLAVGARSVGVGALMLDIEMVAGSELVGIETGAVVCVSTLGRDV